MRQGLYNFRNTKARQSRSSDLQNKQGSSSVQRDTQSSHTDTEETFIEQDTGMVTEMIGVPVQIKKM